MRLATALFLLFATTAGCSNNDGTPVPTAPTPIAADFSGSWSGQSRNVQARPLRNSPCPLQSGPGDAFGIRLQQTGTTIAGSASWFATQSPGAVAVTLNFTAPAERDHFTASGQATLISRFGNNPFPSFFVNELNIFMAAERRLTGTGRIRSEGGDCDYDIAVTADLVR